MKTLLKAIDIFAHLLVYGALAMLVWIFAGHLLEHLWGWLTWMVA